MKNYWNHRDAETEMLLAAAFFQLVRPGYGEKFRDAVKEVMAKVCANPNAFTPKRRGTKMRDIIRKETPDAEIFVWSDMYDPYHNANVRLGACKGTFEGVGDLIPKDVGLMLWYGEKVDKSAPYFAERGHRLMGSICCDGKDVAGAVRKWRDGLSAYPGLRGFMYTTWINEYSKIDAFVRELKRGADR